jgi:hypothetical protein
LVVLAIRYELSEIPTLHRSGLSATSDFEEFSNPVSLGRLCAIEGNLPFQHFFDGFRTSHEVLKPVELGHHKNFSDAHEIESVFERRPR